MKKTITTILALATMLLIPRPGLGLLQVKPVVETAQAHGAGDVADDLAIWIHPDDPNLSTIIGMSKARAGGIHVYSLDGEQLQFIEEGKIGNIDIRQHFPLGGEFVDLVVAGNRSDNTIVIYRVNPSAGKLENVTARNINAGISLYGGCLYHSAITDKFYFIITSKSGRVEQWELFADEKDRVDATMVRTFDVGGITEGCVADDKSAKLYFAEENVGIWKYGAEPGVALTRTKVDKTGKGGHLAADVEGLTIYYADDDSGYLIASSQGNDTFVIYDRQGGNDYLGTFAITANNALGIDGCESTDGIDVTSASLGSAFPDGLFVAHDSRNSGGSSSNYKLVPWQSIVPVIKRNELSQHFSISKAIIKAGKLGDGFSDSAQVFGYLFHLSEIDIENADTIEISMRNEDEAIPIFHDSIEMSRAEYVDGKFRYDDPAGKINYLRFDINTNTFRLRAKDVDLTGLKSPFIMEIQVGDYLAIDIAYDQADLPASDSDEEIDVINGRKPMPMKLLSGYEDSLRVDKCKLRLKSDRPDKDYLSVKGAIAMQDTSVDLAGEDILISWGDYDVILPDEDMHRIRQKLAFKYKKPSGMDTSIAAAIFDLEKCIFKVIIKNAIIGSQGNPVNFGIQFGDGEDEFDETVTVQLTPKSASKFVYP